MNRNRSRVVVKALNATFFNTISLFYVTIALTVLFLVLYVYWIFISVMNVVQREEMLVSIAQAHSDISELEAQYLVKKETIDEAYAQSLGFLPIEKKTFVSVTNENGTSLTLNQ